MSFKKYMHIKRFENDEVAGIELGTCHIFPKIDGTNGSIWFEDEKIKVGSRNRELATEDDNAGFCDYVLNGEKSKNYKCFFQCNPNLRLYGEWLVPHSFKDYQKDAWRKFYVFDVFDDEKEEYLSYEKYRLYLFERDIDFIPPLCVIKNPTKDNILHELESNWFLVDNGKNTGEGVVVKNYNFRNKYGRTTWAKMITNEFKEKHSKNQPTIKKSKGGIEQKIAEKYISEHFVEKTYAKIVNDIGEWDKKFIPRLLQTIYYDLINEEIWSIIKKNKNPVIDFSRLYGLMIAKIKEIKPELF